MYLKAASVLELRSECPRLTDKYTKRRRTAIKTSKSWNGQHDGDREQEDRVILPLPLEGDDKRDVDRTDSQGPVDKEQAHCECQHELRPPQFDISRTRLNPYRGRPCPRIVGVVVHRHFLSRGDDKAARCLTGCECDDGDGLVCRLLDRERENSEGVGIERGLIRSKIV